MRANVWLVAVLVGLTADDLVARAAEGGPAEIAPVAGPIHEDAVVIDVPPNEPPPRPVKVRVYKSPDVTDDVLQAALNVAEATFAAASVQIAWKVCGPGVCNTPPSPAERLVRLVRTPPGGSDDSRCLGDAMIDVQKGTAVLATVYVDRVFEIVRHLQIDPGTLLGRTIAHEVAHLLMATNAHGTSGLMRAVWSQRELLAGRAEDWVLRPVEAAAIRGHLTLVGANVPIRAS